MNKKGEMQTRTYVFLIALLALTCAVGLYIQYVTENCAGSGDFWEYYKCVILLGGAVG